MNQEFIPYEQALELKELGYDIDSVSGYSYPDSDKLLTQAILYQQAFRWFREKHNLKGGILYIGGLKPETTWWDIYVVGHYNIEYNEMEMKYQPYEEAELACLKKLIEIVKNK
jgi:hypothetical protein